jgi:hypothetical protein
MKRNEIIKAMRANAREQVPMSQLRGRSVPMKRRAKLEKIQRKEARDW